MLHLISHCISHPITHLISRLASHHLVSLLVLELPCVWPAESASPRWLLRCATCSQVRHMLLSHDCTESFWMGNLKHKNVAGEEVGLRRVCWHTRVQRVWLKSYVQRAWLKS